MFRTIFAGFAYLVFALATTATAQDDITLRFTTKDFLNTQLEGHYRAVERAAIGGDGAGLDAAFNERRLKAVSERTTPRFEFPRREGKIENGWIGAAFQPRPHMPGQPLPKAMRVTQVIDEGNMIVAIGTNFAWVSMSTEGIADGDEPTNMRYNICKLLGTKTYTTVTGATSTVRHYQMVDVVELRKACKAAWEKHGLSIDQKRVEEAIESGTRKRYNAQLSRFREFTDNKGNKFEAKLVANRRGRLTFELKDGKRKRYFLNRMSAADQTWLKAASEYLK